MGDYDEAMEIYTPALDHAVKIGDNPGIGSVYKSIGAVHHHKGDYDKALEYYNRSLRIKRRLVISLE